MASDKPDMRRLILDLMHQQTARDKQIRVGASNYSDMCNRCVANALVATEPGPSGHWWMGAWHGTSMHNRLEEEAKKHRPTWETEQRLVMGVLKGYGTIKSTTDLYVPEIYTAGDYKSTDRGKLVHIKESLTTTPNDLETTVLVKARHKTNGYLNQVHSYARGLVAMGKRVDWVSLIFVCRDGKTDEDVWAYTEPYNPERAEAVWDRMERMWKWLEQGHTPHELSHNPSCFYYE